VSPTISGQPARLETFSAAIFAGPCAAWPTNPQNEKHLRLREQLCWGRRFFVSARWRRVRSGWMRIKLFELIVITKRFRTIVADFVARAINDRFQRKPLLHRRMNVCLG
jgi:hypothetical protein